MTKTRSQSLKLLVKKEEHGDIPKLEQKLHGTNYPTKSKSKITKNRKPVQAQNAGVKSENADDNKVLLASPKKKTFTKSRITAEQIAKLIGYIVNDKISVAAAARKVGIGEKTAHSYYHKYQDDPEHKIPLPKTRLGSSLPTVTQQDIDKLIRYIVHDGMNLTQAARKADISRTTAAKYYSKYLKNPEQKISSLNVRIPNTSKRYTKEEITDLIGYIVNDKMTVVNASKKVKMAHPTARRYYLQYLQNPNHEIPDPYESNQRIGRHCTNDQVASLIGYIVNDGMTLVEASVKTNMSAKTAQKYYRQYLDDPEKNIPTTKSDNSLVFSNRLTVDQVKTFFCYIIIDKLNITQAARKAEINSSTGYKYYNTYLKSHNSQIKIQDMTYSVEKMKRLVELVQNKKMNVSAAANAVHLSIRTACRYYQQYLKNPQYEFPEIYRSQYTQEDIKMLIDHVEHDKMSVSSAARRIKMGYTTAWKYYKEYKNDPKHRIPAPLAKDHTRKNRVSDKYTQIIADIYKNNPSIKPIHGNHDVQNIEIKGELEEEDTKIALKIKK